MTATGSSGTLFAAVVGAAVFALGVSAVRAGADEAALRLRASTIGAPATASPWAIELFRWSTDAERGPLVAALDPPAPAAPAPVEAVAGRGAGRAAGRGGRGGGGRGAPPASPTVRLSAAVKAAPTVGFVWGAGPTGYSIKYAWRGMVPGGGERIVLVTDRRVSAHEPSAPQGSGASEDADFTVIELHLDARGTGEGKTSLTAKAVVDATARTLALDGYDAITPSLKVSR